MCHTFLKKTCSLLLHPQVVHKHLTTTVYTNTRSKVNSYPQKKSFVRSSLEVCYSAHRGLVQALVLDRTFSDEF